jgi:hypothetical protein
MDNQSNDQPSSVDDQELAKVLAGVNEQMEKGDDSTNSGDTPGLNLEDVLAGNSGSDSNSSDPILPTPPPLPTITTDSRTPLPATPPPTASLDPLSPPAPDQIPSPSSPLTLTPPSQQDTGPVDPALENIKKDALNELRPLVDKLNISGEEKFDTYLLLLRSTDDSSLLAPAHEAAKAITDETRRAQALLDVIKEIDYLSHNQHAA